MALAGRLGVEVTLPLSNLTAVEQLFSESNGRLLLEVPPMHAEALEQHFSGYPLVCVGSVTEAPMIRIIKGDETLLELTVEQAVQAWKGQ